MCKVAEVVELGTSEDEKAPPKLRHNATKDYQIFKVRGHWSPLSEVEIKFTLFFLAGFVIPRWRWIL